MQRRQPSLACLRSFRVTRALFLICEQGTDIRIHSQYHRYSSAQSENLATTEREPHRFNLINFAASAFGDKSDELVVVSETLNSSVLIIQGLSRLGDSKCDQRGPPFLANLLMGARNVSPLAKLTDNYPADQPQLMAANSLQPPTPPLLLMVIVAVRPQKVGRMCSSGNVIASVHRNLWLSAILIGATDCLLRSGLPKMFVLFFYLFESIRAVDFV